MRTKFLKDTYVEKKPTQEEIQQFYDSRPEKYTYLTIFKIFVIGNEDTASEIRNAAKEIKTFKKLENLEGQFKDQVTLLKVDLIGQKRLMAYKDILAPSVGYVSNPIPIEGMKNRYNIYVVAEVEKIDISNFKNAITHTIQSMDKNSQFKNMVSEFKEQNNINIEKF